MNKNGIEVKMIADSISLATGDEKPVRIRTYQLKYHRYIHGEVMTHRVFSRNASSSRAIPVARMRSDVWNNPAMPIHWGRNQKGMQAKGELTGIKLAVAKSVWKTAGKAACVFSWMFEKVGLHKQIANRILEPWQFIHVVLTATDFDNWDELRDHEDAQPEIQSLAKKMKFESRRSIPVVRYPGNGVYSWHLPYVSVHERENYDIETLTKISTARCCRVSYLKHDGKDPLVSEDLALYDRLVGMRPLHASPLEHLAKVADSPFARSGNFRGWLQHREAVEASAWAMS